MTVSAKPYTTSEIEALKLSRTPVTYSRLLATTSALAAEIARAVRAETILESQRQVTEAPHRQLKVALEEVEHLKSGQDILRQALNTALNRNERVKAERATLHARYADLANKLADRYPEAAQALSVILFDDTP